MPDYDKVPVKFDGVEIGEAKVAADGTITMWLQANSMTKDLHTYLKAGFVYGLSLGAIINPSVDGNWIARVAHESETTFHVQKSAGVQFGDGNSQVNTY